MPISVLDLPVELERYLFSLGFDTVERLYSSVIGSQREWQLNLQNLDNSVDVQTLLSRMQQILPAETVNKLRPTAPRATGMRNSATTAPRPYGKVRRKEA